MRMYVCMYEGREPYGGVGRGGSDKHHATGRARTTEPLRPRVEPGLERRRRRRRGGAGRAPEELALELAPEADRPGEVGWGDETGGGMGGWMGGWISQPIDESIAFNKRLAVRVLFVFCAPSSYERAYRGAGGGACRWPGGGRAVGATTARVEGEGPRPGSPRASRGSRPAPACVVLLLFLFLCVRVCTYDMPLSWYGLVGGPRESGGKGFLHLDAAAEDDGVHVGKAHAGAPAEAGPEPERRGGQQHGHDAGGWLLFLLLLLLRL